VTAGRRELFVYYRVGENDWRDACAAVHELQAVLRASHPELTARMMRRPEVGDGLVTLMEVYSIDARSSSDGIDGAWQARIEAAAHVLRRWLRSDRHVECFDAVEG
jgi:hypothetical protein